MIRAEIEHLEDEGILAAGSGDPARGGATPDVVLADDEAVAVVLGRAEEAGLDVTDQDVYHVIESLHGYLASIGAVGPAPPRRRPRQRARRVIAGPPDQVSPSPSLRVLPSQLGRARQVPPAATSSAWLPRSTIRPWSNTSTSSAASAVDSRWAIDTMVRPSASRARAWVSARSVSGSTALVASSRTRRPGSPSCAGQRHQLAFADREAAAAVARARVQPQQQLVQPPGQPELGERLSHVAVIRSGASARTFSQAGVEQEAVLRDQPHRSAPLIGAHGAQVDAPEAHLPVDGSARRHRSLANVVLPDPVSPTTATELPAGTRTSTSCRTGTPSR